MGEEQSVDFADILRAARRSAGLSQEELAERAGLSARAISALERGVNRAPRRDTLTMLADALALPADERRRWDRVRRQQAVRASDTPAGDASLRAEPMGNLPHQPTRFFGRDAEIASLTRMVGEAGTQLVTLTGPGGSGKTRLALHVAASLSDGYPDGAFFVDLAPVSDAALVLPAIGATLGVRPPAGQSVVATLAGWSRGKRLLLVLDNLEQVLAAAPEIGDLLGRCQGIRAVATSRAPLRLRAEREFPVPPLPLPPLDAGTESTPAAGYDVIRLFIDRARAVRPDFDAAGSDALVVAAICRRLDGLPLAIELAAACVRLFPLAAILTRLEQQLPLAAAGHRDAPARQRTLHDTIVWSYDLLQADERGLFRRLSIFKGGWTLDAAEAVAGHDSGAALDVLQGIETLIEHSLIQSHAWLDGSPRFTMLETIREFGLAQLEAAGELQATHQLHAGYLLRLNAGSVEQLRGPGFQSWLQRGDAEIENVRLALDWATIHAPELALRLAREVTWYLLTRGAFIEARQRLERALSNCAAAPDDLRAGALLDMGMHATTYLDFETARTDIESAMALYQRLDDAAGIAECVHDFGRIAMWSDDPERAKPLFEEAIVRFRQLDASTLTVACSNLAAVLIELGEFERAASVLDEALTHGERRGDAWASVLILGSIGDLAYRRGDLARARQATRRSFELLRALQDPRYVAQGLYGCARLAISDGMDEHAARLLGAAERLRETIGVANLPVDFPDYDREVRLAQDRIGADAWTRAWETGRALSQSDAIELAIEGLTLPDEPS